MLPHPPSPDERSGPLGLWVFLVSESGLFLSLWVGTVILRLTHLAVRSALEPQVPFSTGVALSALVCLASVAASDSATSKDIHRTRTGWFLSMLLTLAFLALQLASWRATGRAGLHLGPSVYASSYYVATAVHAAHVLAGLLWLAWAGVRRDLKTRMADSALYFRFLAATQLVTLGVVYGGA